MRGKHSIINISAGIGSQFVITALSFISRTVFIYALGVEYLGVNGLFTSILLMLSIAEAGIGTAIMYSLYKPVADEDNAKIKVLMKLYRNIYIGIAVIVFLLGLLIMPFLDFFMKDSNVPHLHVIFFIFLLNTAVPYLFLHKNSFLQVCQKGYIVTGVYTLSSLISAMVKIGILYFTRNYILFLIVEFMINVISALLLARIVDRKYPYLKEKVEGHVDKETKAGIIKNVKSILLQKIGGYFVFGTDNIMISSFVSVVAVGLYSNYAMFIDICRTFINQIFNNIYHSIGNLVAQESKEKIYDIYKIYQFINFWLYSFFSIFLYLMLEPIIHRWLGKDFLLNSTVLMVLMITFYERGMRNAITTMKTTAGIFHEDRYAPLCQAGVNLIAGLILVQHWGITGVFLGSLISALAVPFWFTPYLVYKKVFQISVASYYKRYFLYFSIGILTTILTSYFCSFIQGNQLSHLIVRGMICLFIPNLFYCLLFYRTKECKYLFEVMRNLSGMLLDKMKMKRKRPVHSET